MIAAVLLRLCDRAGIRPSPDEWTYTQYARAIAVNGIRETPVQVRAYNADPNYWLYPPPIRVGYLYLIAAVIRRSGSVGGLAAVSAGFSILGFIFAAAIGRRYFNRWHVLIALAWLAVCPMDLAMARRVWQDGVVATVGLLLIGCCAEFTAGGGRDKRWLVGFWLVGSYFILLKESCFLIYGVCVLWILAERWWRGCSLRQCALIGLFSALVAVVTLAVLCRLAGGSAAVRELLGHVREGMARNPYVIEYQNGPWYSFVLGFWILSPAVMIFAALALVALVIPRHSLGTVLALNSRQQTVAGLLSFLVVSLLILATVLPNYKSFRFVSILLAPVCLLSGLGVGYVLTIVGQLVGRSSLQLFGALTAVWVLLSAATDYLGYRRIFVRQDQVIDLAIPRIVRWGQIGHPVGVAQFIPSPALADADNGGSPETYLNRSLQHYQAHHYAESIAAAEQALQLRPGYAAAYNNLCAAYNQLGQYAKAVAAGEQALWYQADFPLASNNLAYARQRILQNRF